MRLLVIADVHANLPALKAVLAHAERLSVDQRLCLGDLVGYNAEPSACIEAIRARLDVVVAGNHDWDVCGMQMPLVGTTSQARQAQDWTRAQLEPEQLRYLQQLPNKHVEPGVYIAVHGCFLNEIHVNGYVTQTMLRANLEAVAGRKEWPNLGFTGHTHCPLLAYLHRGEVHWESPSSPSSWPASAQAVLINPGSVGQPRDHNPDASYAYVDTELRTVEIIRVPYDVDATAAAFSGADLPEAFARRLYQGR